MRLQKRLKITGSNHVRESGSRQGWSGLSRSASGGASSEVQATQGNEERGIARWEDGLFRVLIVLLSWKPTSQTEIVLEKSHTRSSLLPSEETICLRKVDPPPSFFPFSLLFFDSSCFLLSKSESKGRHPEFTPASILCG